jgi:hypothetical protein
VKAAHFFDGLLIIYHSEVSLLQVSYVTPVLVGDSEHYIHFVGGGPDLGNL